MPIVERLAVGRRAELGGQWSGPGVLRVVAVGFGAIVQSKYLPALLKLSPLYDVVAVINPSAPPRELARQRFPQVQTFSELPDDLAELGPFDAALLFTPPGVRPGFVERFLDHGVHVLAEKPLALTADVAARLAQRAVERQRLLMVTQTRRFDSECAHLIESLDPASVSTASAVTLETRWQSIVELAPLARPLGSAVEFDQPLAQADRLEIASALGTDDERVLRYYRWAIAECLIHDIDLLAHVLGPAEVVETCSFAQRGVAVSALVRFGGVDSVLQWTLAPGLGRYDQAFQFITPDRRYTLRYPSAFLPNAPAQLTVDSGGLEPTGHSSTTTVTSYEDAFLRLLESFATRVANGDVDPSSAFDAAHSLRVAEAMARAELQSGPVEVSEHMITKEA